MIELSTYVFETLREDGIGKSSVVHELHKVLVPPRGLFASGKFDQHKRDIPYATLAQAFQSLVRPLLGQSEAELGWWRGALSESLGSNGQLIVNLVPALELVLGAQPPVPDLPPHEAQNRFQMVFRRFPGVFTDNGSGIAASQAARREGFGFSRCELEPKISAHN